MLRIATSRRSWCLLALVGFLAGCDVGGAGLLGGSPAEAVAEDKATPQAKSQDCNAPSDAEQTADQMFRLMNIERFEIGGVELDPELSAIATRYACSMIDDSFFGHVNPRTGDSLVERVTAAGYEYYTVGENLAAGISHAPAIIDAWMASDAHRDVLMDPAFTRAGIAVRHGGAYGVYCVLLLAEPAE